MARPHLVLPVLLVALGVSAPEAHAADSGGSAVPTSPTVRSVSCMPTADARCPSSARVVVRGSRIRLTGRAMSSAEQLIFKGRRGRADDVAVAARNRGRFQVVARVPRRAKTGPLLLVDEMHQRTVALPKLRVLAAPDVDDSDGEAFYLDGKRKPTVSFAGTGGPMEVNVLDADSNAIGSFETDTASGPQEYAWNGRIDGRRVPAGTYSLTVGAIRGGPFELRDHLFPIRGKHDLGQTRTNQFGGGRGHQGTDMFADCGTPIAAARGGRVQYAGYQSRAGNYVVIDIAGSGRDEVYMHMQSRPQVKTGERVFTGQRLGLVGDTGRATGCHLHFEIWTAPGWYKGGRAINAAPALRRWDRDH